MTRCAQALGCIIALVTFTIATAQPLVIEDIVRTETAAAATQDKTIEAARAFYEFWNTGDAALLERATAPTFVDRTLPPGRPQGPSGPAYASRQFRAAVPDLAVRVRKMIVAEGYVTAHMIFTGHFTGTFGSVHGTGQAISFLATDLLKVTDGRITDNWHIEDNLTLLREMGVVPPAP